MLSDQSDVSVLASGAAPPPLASGTSDRDRQRRAAALIVAEWARSRRAAWREDTIESAAVPAIVPAAAPAITAAITQAIAPPVVPAAAPATVPPAIAPVTVQVVAPAVLPAVAPETVPAIASVVVSVVEPATVPVPTPTLIAEAPVPFAGLDVVLAAPIDDPLPLTAHEESRASDAAVDAIVLTSDATVESRLEVVVAVDHQPLMSAEITDAQESAPLHASAPVPSAIVLGARRAAAAAVEFVRVLLHTIGTIGASARTLAGRATGVLLLAAVRVTSSVWSGVLAAAAARRALTTARSERSERSGHAERSEASEPRANLARAGAAWAMKGAAATAMVAILVAGLVAFGTTVRAQWVRVSTHARTIPFDRIPGTRTTAAPVARRTGRLEVTSDPSGARVLVDGRERGVTPAVFDDIVPGSHALVLESADGVVRRTVAVEANGTVSVNEPIYAGWVALFSPFEMTMSEGGRLVHLDDRGRVMLPPGPHDLRLENAALDYREVRHVDLKPGEVFSISIVPPPSRLSVTAPRPAEVWVDGQHVGDTPLTDLPLDLGTRDVVVRAYDGEQRRFPIAVTPKPIHLDIEF